ncbi:MAG TPA: hypothetical protein VG944_00805 [Fimbriimonas sp.]|nr:hypothetical protein [Fimbriimonas sp.]
MTARQKMAQAAAGWVAELEPEKAARFKAKTMLIPSPVQVEQAISAIAMGECKSLLQVRRELAQSFGAEVTCPYAARVGWELAAEAAEEDRLAGASSVTPWWRVTKDGKPHSKLPGGAENHRRLLLMEGVSI